MSCVAQGFRQPVNPLGGTVGDASRLARVKRRVIDDGASGGTFEHDLAGLGGDLGGNTGNTRSTFAERNCRLGGLGHRCSCSGNCGCTGGPHGQWCHTTKAFGRKEPADTSLDQAGTNVFDHALGLHFGQWRHEPQDRCIRGPWFPWSRQAGAGKLISRQVAQHALGQVPGTLHRHPGDGAGVGADVPDKALRVRGLRLADIPRAE